MDDRPGRHLTAPIRTVRGRRSRSGRPAVGGPRRRLSCCKSITRRVGRAQAVPRLTAGIGRRGTALGEAPVTRVWIGEVASTIGGQTQEWADRSVGSVGVDRCHGGAIIAARVAATRPRQPGASTDWRVARGSEILLPSGTETESEGSARRCDTLWRESAGRDLVAGRALLRSEPGTDRGVLTEGGTGRRVRFDVGRAALVRAWRRRIDADRRLRRGADLEAARREAPPGMGDPRLGGRDRVRDADTARRHARLRFSQVPQMRSVEDRAGPDRGSSAAQRHEPERRHVHPARAHDRPRPGVAPTSGPHRVCRDPAGRDRDDPAPRPDPRSRLSERRCRRQPHRAAHRPRHRHGSQGARQRDRRRAGSR